MLRVYVGINPLLPPPLRAAPDFLHHWWGCSAKDFSIEVQLNRRWKLKEYLQSKCCDQSGGIRKFLSFYWWKVVFFNISDWLNTILPIYFSFQFQGLLEKCVRWQVARGSLGIPDSLPLAALANFTDGRVATFGLLSLLFQVTDLESSRRQWIPNWHEKASQKHLSTIVYWIYCQILLLPKEDTYML